MLHSFIVMTRFMPLLSGLIFESKFNRHDPACPGHPRLPRRKPGSFFPAFRAAKTWMARIKRAMTVLGFENGPAF
ncbi:MAG: hypothetical protein H5U13_05625 [Parvibaculum sp.]|nr:hypothetical protein [Parvibaculum sp.]